MLEATEGVLARDDLSASMRAIAQHAGIGELLRKEGTLVVGALRLLLIVGW